MIPQREPLQVSLLQLIASPNDYDGKVVCVIGFLRLEFEGDSLYLHEDDFQHNIFKNGLWLHASESMYKREAELDRKYVQVVGTFNAKMTGHLGLWSGSLQNITRCEVWLQRDETK